MSEKRVTVSIRADLHRWLKIWSVQNDLSLQEAMDLMIERFKDQQVDKEE